MKTFLVLCVLVLCSGCAEFVTPEQAELIREAADKLGNEGVLTPDEVGALKGLTETSFEDVAGIVLGSVAALASAFFGIQLRRTNMQQAK